MLHRTTLETRCKHCLNVTKGNLKETTAKLEQPFQNCWAREPFLLRATNIPDVFNLKIYLS